MIRATFAAAACLAVPAFAQVDEGRARMYFEQASELCKREDGRIWGISLCGPMVFADAATRTIATNQAAPTDPWPAALGYANAAMEWGGERWSTFVWSTFPIDERARARIMMHELFHRVQPKLGLFVSASDRENAHLDTLEGRYWLQLEWRALAKALEAQPPDRVARVVDALAFRTARRDRFPDAVDAERRSEINEGLAQYTGTVAAAPTREGAVLDAIDQLNRAPLTESFVRTFAYATGAAYGLLLDEWSPGWTRRVKASDDLGSLLAGSRSLDIHGNLGAAESRYGGTALREAEAKREREHALRVAELRRLFVEGPVLVVPRGRNASFVTAGVTPIPGAGTIYPKFRVGGDWGSIEAEQVLLSLDGNTLTVPAPTAIDAVTITGAGWRVSLAPGWLTRAGPRPGDLQVVRADD